MQERHPFADTPPFEVGGLLGGRDGVVISGEPVDAYIVGNEIERRWR